MWTDRKVLNLSVNKTYCKGEEECHTGSVHLSILPCWCFFRLGQFMCCA